MLTVAITGDNAGFFRIIYSIPASLAVSSQRHGEGGAVASLLLLGIVNWTASRQGWADNPPRRGRRDRDCLAAGANQRQRPRSMADTRDSRAVAASMGVISPSQSSADVTDGSRSSPSTADDDHSYDDVQSTRYSTPDLRHAQPSSPKGGSARGSKRYGSQAVISASGGAGVRGTSSTPRRHPRSASVATGLAAASVGGAGGLAPGHDAHVAGARSWIPALSSAPIEGARMPAPQPGQRYTLCVEAVHMVKRLEHVHAEFVMRVSEFGGSRTPHKDGERLDVRLRAQWLVRHRYSAFKEQFYDKLPTVRMWRLVQASFPSRAVFSLNDKEQHKRGKLLDAFMREVSERCVELDRDGTDKTPFADALNRFVRMPPVLRIAPQEYVRAGETLAAAEARIADARARASSEELIRGVTDVFLDDSSGDEPAASPGSSQRGLRRTPVGKREAAGSQGSDISAHASAGTGASGAAPADSPGHAVAGKLPGLPEASSSRLATKHAEAAAVATECAEDDDDVVGAALTEQRAAEARAERLEAFAEASAARAEQAEAATQAAKAELASKATELAGLNERLTAAVAAREGLEAEVAELRAAAEDSERQLREAQAGRAHAERQGEESGKEMASKLADIEGQLAAAKDEADEAKRKAAEMSRSLRRARGDVAARNVQLQDHRGAAKQAEAEAAAALEAAVADGQHAKELLKEREDELTKLNEQLGAAKLTITELTNTANEAKLEIEAAKEDAARTAKELTDAEGRVRTLEAELVAIRGDKESARAQRDRELASRIGELEAENAKHVAALTAVEQTAAALRQAETTARAESARVESKLRDAESRLVDTRAKLEAAAEQLNVAQRERDVARQQSVEAGASLSRVNSELDACKKEDERLRDDVESARRYASKLKGEVLAFETETERMRGELASRQHESDRLREQVEAAAKSLEQEKSASLRTSTQLQARLSEAEEALRAAEERATADVERAREEESNAQRLASELNAERATVAKLHAEARQAKAVSADSHKDADAARTEREELAAQLRATEAEVIELRHQVESLQEGSSAAEAEKRDAELKAELQTTQAAELRHKLCQRLKDLGDRAQRHAVLSMSQSVQRWQKRRLSAAMRQWVCQTLIQAKSNAAETGPKTAGVLHPGSAERSAIALVVAACERRALHLLERQRAAIAASSHVVDGAQLGVDTTMQDIRRTVATAVVAVRASLAAEHAQAVERAVSDAQTEWKSQLESACEAADAAARTAERQRAKKELEEALGEAAARHASELAAASTAADVDAQRRVREATAALGRRVADLLEQARSRSQKGDDTPTSDADDASSSGSGSDQELGTDTCSGGSTTDDESVDSEEVVGISADAEASESAAVAGGSADAAMLEEANMPVEPAEQVFKVPIEDDGPAGPIPAEPLAQTVATAAVAGVGVLAALRALGRGRATSIVGAGLAVGFTLAVKLHALLHVGVAVAKVGVTSDSERLLRLGLMLAVGPSQRGFGGDVSDAVDGGTSFSPLPDGDEQGASAQLATSVRVVDDLLRLSGRVAVQRRRDSTEGGAETPLVVTDVDARKSSMGKALVPVLAQLCVDKGFGERGVHVKAGSAPVAAAPEVRAVVLRRAAVRALSPLGLACLMRAPALAIPHPMACVRCLPPLLDAATQRRVQQRVEEAGRVWRPPRTAVTAPPGTVQLPPMPLALCMALGSRPRLLRTAVALGAEVDALPRRAVVPQCSPGAVRFALEAPPCTVREAARALDSLCSDVSGGAAASATESGRGESLEASIDAGLRRRESYMN